MKNRSTNARHLALKTVATAALLASFSSSWALGLGRLTVQSALGENLRAVIDVSSLTADEEASLRVRIAPPESYKAAGVEYNATLASSQVQLARWPDGRPYLRVTSDRAVNEPFVDVILEISWATGRLVREYTMLFDPPGQRPAAPAAAAAPVAPAISPAAPGSTSRVTPAPAIAARPLPAEPPAPAPERRPAKLAPAPKAPPAAAADAAPTPSPATTAGGDEVKVRRGDTLSAIAGRTQRPGVSLDQMLVALYRGNPSAFVDNNMNRLKAGVVLSVPSAETAKSVSPSEARETIQAQSADFGAYRRRLASGVPTAAPAAPAQQAKGKVQAAVEDKKPATAAPDKLTLSQGQAKAASAADAVSKATEKKDTATRVAELTRNVEELKKLQQGTAASAPAAKPASPAPAPAVQAPPPAPSAPAAPAKVASAPTPAPASAPVAVVPPLPASVAAPAAPAVASAPVAASAPVVASAPAAEPVASAASRPAAPEPLPPAEPVEEPGFLGSLLESPLVLPGAGVLLALLAGFGIYRVRGKLRKDSGETSFLESRLQPDSFFGASGGQRVDTRDGGGSSSSMSYSLSQLDAIGDVDPVAEADVYLAYGRDLQAEEILKEAMRANPERLAIRSKLLEVYAKRRDTKGFELLATQMFALVKGEGEDWTKAQELGRQIDSENPLYQPGGRPQVAVADSGQIIEPLGASTMPQSVMPATSSFPESGALGLNEPPTTASGIDLDLDLGTPTEDFSSPSAPPPATAPSPLEATASFGNAMERTEVLPADAAAQDFGADLDFDLQTPPATASAAAAAADAPPMAFDLGSISLDLDAPAAAPAAAPEVEPLPASDSALDFGDFALSEPAPSGMPDDEADPLSRKLELADEFRQIGDVEGARDLLEEVVAKASGALKTKAQTMLDDLA